MISHCNVTLCTFRSKKGLRSSSTELRNYEFRGITEFNGTARSGEYFIEDIVYYFNRFLPLLSSNACIWKIFNNMLENWELMKKLLSLQCQEETTRQKITKYKQ